MPLMIVDAEALGDDPLQMPAEGVDLPTISERMGHSSVRTTADIYAHAMRGKDDAAAKVWDAIQERDRAQK